jgi:hypothetical protein
MRIGIIALAVGFLLLSFHPVSAQGKRGRDQDAAKYGWLPSLAEGKAQAKKTGKPILVVLRCVP